ncbi:BKACE family enzyme [Paracoccus jeotgali]|uniref:Class III aminotransferase n=1 Tax=Paracoccus jeotgali TaxID=2065379 RepID=A0A2K9MDM6_9RHOB|nr:3-keto-5-aminohexanoate cleavage protein [Paracoccus jeotgali]AUM73703.1 class III aminotransferase [Paracoccus jeotgali]
MSLPRIMVAPNGARRGKADHPALPVTIPELVACAAACHAEGAGGIHAHVRDADGHHVLDAGLYRELIAELSRQVPGMAIQITTEAVGRYSPAEQRALVAELQPAMVSVALREITAEPDAGLTRAFFHDCDAAGIAVQHILYDVSEVDRLAELIKDGTIPGETPQLLHVLGRYSEGQVSSPADLDAPLSRQRALGLQADWAVCAFGPAETDCLLAALEQGGKARIGFENNLFNADGGLAASNAERVAELVSRMDQVRR